MFKFFLCIFYDVINSYRESILLISSLPKTDFVINFTERLERIRHHVSLFSPLMTSEIIWHGTPDQKSPSLMFKLSAYDHVSEPKIRKCISLTQLVFSERDPRAIGVFESFLKILEDTDESFDEQMRTVLGGLSFETSTRTTSFIEIVHLLKSLLPIKPIFETVTCLDSAPTCLVPHNGERFLQILKKLAPIKYKSIIVPTLRKFTPFMVDLNKQGWVMDEDSFIKIMSHALMIEGIDTETSPGSNRLDNALHNLICLNLQNGREVQILLSVAAKSANENQEISKEKEEKDWFFEFFRDLSEKIRVFRERSGPRLLEQKIEALQGLAQRPFDDRKKIKMVVDTLNLTSPSLYFIMIEALSKKDASERDRFITAFKKLEKKYQSKPSQGLLSPPASSRKKKSKSDEFLEALEEELSRSIAPLVVTPL
ncbi:MAG: hypothetical protein JSS34_02005 [Proteobacteria bacterium]|nr:hypothetical protein [Pseudomonadota bacterium]